MIYYCLLYLCHVCKSEVGVRVSLVFLDNFEKLCLPLHSHFELDVGTKVVVEGEGHDQSFSIGIIIIWERKAYTSKMVYILYSTNI